MNKIYGQTVNMYCCCLQYRYMECNYLLEFTFNWHCNIRLNDISLVSNSSLVCVLVSYSFLSKQYSLSIVNKYQYIRSLREKTRIDLIPWHGL